MLVDVTEYRSARHSCAYQLGDVLPQLNVHSLVGKTELLEAVCTPGMAPALGLRVRLAAQVAEAPLIVWTTDIIAYVTDLKCYMCHVQRIHCFLFHR
jgi:hypothetical protein